MQPKIVQQAGGLSANTWTDVRSAPIRDRNIAQSKDLDENPVLDLDADGNVCAITFEHAGDHTDVHRLTVEGIAA